MNRKIERAIRRATGYKGVRVDTKGGCCIFFSDECELPPLSAVYVPQLNHLTIEQWVEEFKTSMEALTHI